MLVLHTLFEPPLSLFERHAVVCCACIDLLRVLVFFLTVCWLPTLTQ